MSQNKSIKASACNAIFNQAIADYHLTDDVDAALKNPYPSESFEQLLYLKNWIDTVQWHLEDIIRVPEIKADDAIKIKRRIDASNQHRTDVVEKLDDWYLTAFKNTVAKSNAKLNTESPAWVLDRMSILCLKIYHMQEQTMRSDVDAAHLATCQNKLAILSEQQVDLSTSFDQLMADIASGEKYMKVYRQMKMYNDEKLNPSLYKRQQN